MKKIYNEYLTAEQNEALDREAFMSADAILDADEKELDILEASSETDAILEFEIL